MEEICYCVYCIRDRSRARPKVNRVGLTCKPSPTNKVFLAAKQRHNDPAELHHDGGRSADDLKN